MTHTPGPWTLCTYSEDKHRFPHVHFGPPDGPCATPPETYESAVHGTQAKHGNYITINEGPSFQIGSTRVQTAADARLIATAPELLKAAQAAEHATRQEWLYQTGQFSRPEQDFPRQGSVCSELADAGQVLREAIAHATEVTP